MGLMLTTRLANDLRVCWLSAQHGYGVQALAIGATIVEIVGALACVGGSESRALEWAKHTDLKHSYPRKGSEGIDSALASLQIPGSAMEAARENWHQAYMFMCMAKHANRRTSMLNGLRIDPDDKNWEFGYGPDASAYGIHMSAEALYYDWLWYVRHLRRARSLLRRRPNSASCRSHENSAGSSRTRVVAQCLEQSSAT